jgi:hypothetical protein
VFKLAPLAPNASSGGSVDRETTLWKSVESLGSADAYRVYLKKHPDGEYSEVARLKTASLAPVALARPTFAKTLPATNPDVVSHTPVAPRRPERETKSLPTIVIRSIGVSWVQIRDSDSTTVMTRVMRSGDEYQVPKRRSLRLFTGNSGALEISINGVLAPKMGPIGAIARNIPLDESLLQRSAPQPER